LHFQTRLPGRRVACLPDIERCLAEQSLIFLFVSH
jgi:hypothetical protein